jgi:branched-chain amino acid transport system substrate-binding protein
MTQILFKISALAFASTCVLGQAAQAQIKIGFLATMSGPSASVGLDQFDGFTLALEQLGGKLGGVAATVIREDDQQKPDAALQGLSKLLERDKVDIVTGLTFANILMAMQNQIAATDVPFIGSVAGPSPTAGALCKPNLFITSWQSDGPAEAMGLYMETKGYKKAATFTPNFVGGKDKIAGLKRTYKGQIPDEVYTPLTQIDFSAEIAQMSASKPDAVFAFYPGALGVTFVKQYQQAGLLGKIPLLAVNTIEGAGLNAMGAAAIGSVVADTWTPGMPNEETKNFNAVYEAKYKRSPSAYAAFSYDAALLLDAALKTTRGNFADKKALNQAIAKAKFKSLRGEFQFGRNNYPVQNYHIFQLTKTAAGTSYKMVAENILKRHADAYVAQCPMR